MKNRRCKHWWKRYSLVSRKSSENPMWMTLIIFALYKRQRDDWCNGSTATTRWYRFLIVVGGGSSPSSSPIDYTFGFSWRHNVPLRCFYSVCCLSVKTGSYLVSRLHFINNVLHNKCSPSVKIDCTIRICSSTVERRGHHPETGTSDSSQIHEEWKLWV